MKHTFKTVQVLFHIFFSTSASGFNSILPGSLYISRIGIEGADQDLQLQNDRLLAGNKMSTFQYEIEGSLKSLTTGKYLTVDEFGKLCLAVEPHYGFDLKFMKGFHNRNILSYNGIKVFELCGDGSIGCKSRCNAASEIIITYEDLF